MAQADTERAKIDGYTAGRQGEPSRPPNEHGHVHALVFKSLDEAKEDDAYRESFKEGEKDRKRHES